jgi:hypothetical protein
MQAQANKLGYDFTARSRPTIFGGRRVVVKTRYNPKTGQVEQYPSSTPDTQEEEETGLAQFVAEETVQTVMGTMIGVRELSGMVKFDQSRRDYSGPTGLSTLTDLYRLGDQVVQNEWDAAYRRALLNAAGDLFGVPSVQINRTLDGIDYMMENETADPRALIFGTRAK